MSSCHAAATVMILPMMMILCRVKAVSLSWFPPGFKIDGLLWSTVKSIVGEDCDDHLVPISRHQRLPEWRARFDQPGLNSFRGYLVP